MIPQKSTLTNFINRLSFIYISTIAVLKDWKSFSFLLWTFTFLKMPCKFLQSHLLRTSHSWESPMGIWNMHINKFVFVFLLLLCLLLQIRTYCWRKKIIIFFPYNQFPNVRWWQWKHWKLMERLSGPWKRPTQGSRYHNTCEITVVI
jgi:hypothetical protein